MNFVIYPKYQNLYQGPTPELKDVLAEIPSETIIKIACHINAQKHLSQIEIRDDLEIFRLMIERLPPDRYQYLADKIREFTLSIYGKGQRVILFPLTQMLQLVEHTLINYVEGPIHSVNPDEEENILKAILILNEKNEAKHLVEYNELPKSDDFLRAISLMWPIMLPVNDYMRQKDIVIPIYQSFLLLEFLESNKFFSKFLSIYFSKNGVKSADEYLRNLVKFYLFSFDKEKGKFFTFYEKDGFESNPVLLQFVREIDSDTSTLFSSSEKRMKLLREKPILKFPEGKYFIINWNFIIDKIYEGLKYDFFEYSSIKDSLKGSNDKEKWNSFSSMLNQNFSEKIIFLDVISRIIKNDDTICIPEDNKQKWNQDLYSRNNNHVCFTEFKGVVLPINENFNLIKNDVEERMSFNAKEGKKKAVFQLIDQIVDFHANINKFENIEVLGYKKENLFVYPVIVYTDFNWSMAGVSEHLSRIFREEISKYNLCFFRIEELTMIHIDFFNEFEKVFLEHKLRLHQVISRARSRQEMYRVLHRKTGSANHFPNTIADFGFYAAQAFKGMSSSQNEMSLFEEILRKLNLPKE